MNDYYQLSTHRLYQKFQKVCRQLDKLLQAGKAISSEKITSLRKRRERYAKQLLLLCSPLAKAGSALVLSTLLSAASYAQNCNTFFNADSANPIRRAGLPQNLIQPNFVDIDGDGDLDCYESNANQQDGGGSTLKVTFLRNTGTKKLPYFEVQGGFGFGNTSTIAVPYNSDVNRTTFVDIDGDGDYDCFVGYYSYHSGAIFYKNTGTATKPNFVNTPAENPLAGIGGTYGFQISFADLDNDGDYDLTVSDLYKTKIFLNVGTKTSPKFQSAFQSYTTSFGRVTLYDYNKDGLTDFFLGNADINTGNTNYTNFFRNTGSPTHPKFKYDKYGPVFAPGFLGLFSFADLNNDGFTEAFSIHGSYATTAPVATIKKTTVSGQPNDPDDVLHAYPDSSSFTYRWRKDRQYIDGETSAVLPLNGAGSYIVEITSPCGTGNSLPYVVSETEATQSRIASSFAKPIIATQPSLKAYPNPFTQQFTLNLGNNYSPNTIIKISDVQGRIINTIKADNNVMQLGGNLQNGVYIVQVIQNNTVVLTQKMIKE